MCRKEKTEVKIKRKVSFFSQEGFSRAYQLFHRAIQSVLKHTSNCKYTYGLPPGIPVRLGGIPGTLMWGWGSKPTLRRKRSAYEYSANTHLSALAKCTQVDTNLWYRTQTLMSTKQTGTLEHTHPAHLTSLRVSKRTRTVSTCPPLNPTHTHARTHTQLASTQPEVLSSVAQTAVSLLNLFKQCNEH